MKVQGEGTIKVNQYQKKITTTNVCEYFCIKNLTQANVQINICNENCMNI